MQRFHQIAQKQNCDLVCRRSEYVGESELATPSAWYQQQLRGHRHSGAFLRSDLYRFRLLSLQTKVSVWGKKKKKTCTFPFEESLS